MKPEDISNLEMRNGTNYGKYSDETTVIEAFEAFAEELLKEKMVFVGKRWDDVEDWFLCFRAGFVAGGSN